MIQFQTRANYESTMSEWLAVEAIIRQRNKEVMAQNMARLMSESQGTVTPTSNTSSSAVAKDVKVPYSAPQKVPISRTRTLSNEVGMWDLLTQNIFFKI